MKRIFFITTILAGLTATAQDGKINLKKGQKITITATANSETDMGMGSPMVNNSASTTSVEVIGEDDQTYKVTNTLKKMNMNISVMGQETKYDSDVAADKDSEVGKEMAKKMNIPDTFLIEKKTGNVKSVTKKAEDENNDPFSGIFNAMGNGEGDATIESAFFNIPSGKKVGDSWTENSTLNNLKTTKTFTIKSIDKNIATITVTGSISGDIQSEAQGTTINFTMNTKNNGEMTVDTKTGLVSKITNAADVSGTMDVMGQSMPISSKGTTTIAYQY